MSKPPLHTVDSAVPDEVVTRFLESHPDYLLRHPRLLAALDIPHLGKGAAESLIERQVKVLREHNQTVSNELRQLVDRARENEQLVGRVQRFAVAMVEARSPDEAADVARDMLRQEFELDAVVLCLPTDAGLPLAALEARLAERKPLPGVRLDSEERAALFGRDAIPLLSVALVPLTPRGMLVLGSRDARRFTPDMGTVHLERLGALLSAALGRGSP